MASAYLAVLFALAVAALIAGILAGAGALLRPFRPSPVESEPFECGNPSGDPARGSRLGGVLFDRAPLDRVRRGGRLPLPLGGDVPSARIFGFVEMAIFVFILALGFVHVWRKGTLEWA